MGWQWHQLDHMQLMCNLIQTDMSSCQTWFSLWFCNTYHVSKEKDSSTASIQVKYKKSQIQPSLHYDKTYICKYTLKKLSLYITPNIFLEFILYVKFCWQSKLKKSKQIQQFATYTATPQRELTCHMGSHRVTCHPADVTFPPLPQQGWYSI